MNWLIDTNVISETRKLNAAAKVLVWLESLTVSQLFTSEMNMAELVYGAGKANGILQQREIIDWIDLKVRPLFAGRVVAANENTLVRWRLITRERNLAKSPAPAFDLLIAATAIENGLAVATRDVAPFVACGIPTFNPFTGERFNGA
jgi:toxin FitB